MNDGVALIRSHRRTRGKLVVGVRRVDDQSGRVVDDGEGGEAVAGTELAAPAGGDGVHTTRGASLRCLVGGSGALGVRGKCAAGLGCVPSLVLMVKPQLHWVRSG